MEPNQPAQKNQYKFAHKLSYADVANSPIQRIALIKDLNGHVIEIPYYSLQQNIGSLISYFVEKQNINGNIGCKPQMLRLKDINSNKLYMNDVRIQQISKQLKKGTIQVVQAKSNESEQIVDQLCILSNKLQKQYDPKMYKADKEGKKKTFQVKSMDSKFEITVLDTDTIGRLKEVIGIEMQISWDSVKITSLGASPRNDAVIKNTQFINCKQITAFEQKNIEELKKKQSFHVRVLMKQIVQGEIHNVVIDSEKQKINEIHKSVALAFQIPENSFYLEYRGQILQLDKRLTDYQIKSGSPIIAQYKKQQKRNLRSLSQETITNNQAPIIFRIEGSKQIRIRFQEISNMTVLQFLEICQENSKPFWSFYYGQKIYYPHQKMQQLKGNIQPQMTIKILKNQRFFFNIRIKDNINFSEVAFPEIEIDLKLRIAFQTKLKLKNRANLNAIQTNQQISVPIQYFSYEKCHKQINQFLNNLNVNDPNMYNKKQFLLINSLIIALRKIPNFIGQVFRGPIDFKFSKNHEVGQLICCRHFLSATTEKKIVQNLSQKNSCIVHIQSRCGKSIANFSLFEDQKQVVFLPFTYFMIDHIKIDGQREEVWLTQVPSPQSFKKKIIAWVDDQPQKTQKYIQTIGSQIQVLQLSSTKMASKWMLQFNKLLKLRRIQLKVVSDMVRAIVNPENKKKQQFFQAGIDLVQDFNNKHGYTTKILIFCGDVQKATENINKRGIQDKIQHVTKKKTQLVKFCKS